MGVYKDKQRGTWYASVHYTDWQGKKRTKTRRGFRTKAEAEAYEDSFRREESSTLDMKFSEFAEVYERDVRPTIRENTWNTKEHIIKTKLVPYFGELRMNAIQPRDIRRWQNEIKKLVNENGEPYTETYLKTIQGQLSAIFNHAVRFYSLYKNPCHAAGGMGSSVPNKEMKFWTREEYLKFIPCVSDKPMSYYAFELLYWCGIREGELLALTPADFDFEKSMLHITKSLQRIHGQPIVTKPKTKKSIRSIKMPRMVNLEMQDYINCFYGAKDDTRIFPISKGYLHHEMDRGAALAGVKRIRVHDLRHSHVSLLKYTLQTLEDAGMFGHRTGDGKEKQKRSQQTISKQFLSDSTKESEAMDRLLHEMISSRGILFTGKGASGKTTLMNAKLAEIPHDESVMICQENSELFDEDHPDLLAAHVLVNGGDSKVSYTLGDLTRAALLMDLDRVIVGEVKEGSEAAGLSKASMTGHTSFSCNISSNKGCGACRFATG